MKSISETPLCRRPIADFLNKKRVQNKGDCPTVLCGKTAEPIILVTFIVQVQEEMIHGRTSTAEPTGKRGFTAASMPYPALFTAPSAGRFIAVSHGITGESTPPCGGVVPVGTWTNRL